MNGITEHIKEVSRWLDENVATYPTPTAITLSDFEIDLDQMSGKFYVSLDGQRMQEPFRISLAQNGWVQFHPPMFTSPLGAPASYVAIELTEETSKAIEKALQSIIPRMKAFGVDRETGVLISQKTPFADRIVDREEFYRAQELVSQAGFSITAEL